MKLLLLILGSPVWLPILVVIFAGIISITVSLWAVVASLWAVFVAAAISAPLSVVIGIMNIISGSGAYGSAVIAVGIGFGIAAVILFYVSLYSTKGMCALTRKTRDAIESIRYSFF